MPIALGTLLDQGRPNSHLNLMVACNQAHTVSYRVQCLVADAYIEDKISQSDFDTLAQSLFPHEDQIDLITSVRSGRTEKEEYILLRETQFNFDPSIDDGVSDLEITLSSMGIDGDMREFISGKIKNAAEHLAWSALLSATGLSLDGGSLEGGSSSVELISSISEMGMENDTEGQSGSMFDSAAWQDAKEACEGLSEEAGAATEAIYSAGGVAGAAAGAYLGEHVEEHWSDVCALPENIAAEVDNVIGGMDDIAPDVIDPGVIATEE